MVKNVFWLDTSCTYIEEFKINSSIQAVFKTNRAQAMLNWEEFWMRACAFESGLTEWKPLRFLGKTISPTQSLCLLKVVEENALCSPSVSQLRNHYWWNWSHHINWNKEQNLFDKGMLLALAKFWCICLQVTYGKLIAQPARGICNMWLLPSSFLRSVGRAIKCEWHRRGECRLFAVLSRKNLRSIKLMRATFTAKEDNSSWSE